MKMFPRKLSGQSLLIISILFAIIPIIAQENMVSDKSILLPAQNERAMPGTISKQQKITSSQRWQSFVAKHGQWSVQWNEATMTPHRAFGKAIQIQGYSHITEENVDAASRAFLQENQKMMGIDLAALEMTRAQKVNNRWYVSYRQMVGDIPVLFSEVELRIFENGRIMSFGTDFFPEIQVALKPEISADDARRFAIQDLAFNTATDKTAGNEDLYILPIREDMQLAYHLVYWVNVETVAPAGNFITLVDAQTGDVLWRHNRVRSIDVRSSGTIQEVEPTGPFVERSFANQKITINGIDLITNEEGIVTPVLFQDVPFTARLEGPFVNVNRQNGPDAEITGTVSTASDLTILWDDSNSHPAERVAFYHANIIHDFITTLDPGFTRISYSMPCAVNINDNCNAFWNGTGINFFIAGGGCPNTAQMPSVVYHEYGHGINDKLYEQAGSPFGMINGATHEGMADVASVMLEDVPNIGRGFGGAGTTLRNVNNNRRFPENLTGAIHSDGLIIGGAFWDLRELTDLETMQRLAHFAKYGVPDDPNTSIAFSEWFVEVLVADDDDGDISNGTPNFAAINEAFSKHGIGSNLFMTLSFQHTPFSDTENTSSPYPLSFHLEGFDALGGKPDSLFVRFSVDNFQTVTAVAAADAGNGNYTAEIPAQVSGEEVQYIITAVDPLSGADLKFPINGSYSFLVGFSRQLIDNLERESGWTVGAAEDDATTGVWERADPQATDLGSQPADDNTANGTLCYVTGAAAGNAAGAFDIDNGRTTLFSPIFDLSNMENPVIRYFKWYSNDRGATPGTDFWKVDISNNGGQTWINLENTRESTDGWEKFQFRVLDVLEPTGQIQLRFTASDLGQASLVEALIDDVEILSQAIVTGIEDEQTVSALPKEFALNQNYPNPFNPATAIDFAVPNNARVTLSVFNLLGQEIRTLVSGERQPGAYSVTWDGRDDFGKAVASGLYIYKMTAISTSGEAGNFTQSRKLMLLK